MEIETDITRADLIKLSLFLLPREKSNLMYVALNRRCPESRCRGTRG